MEISAKVLREVEFSGSLRGYNTDEVDEFLEQVAIAVDALQSETRSAVQRAEQAEQQRPERSAIDEDDSIRRTLVLAQRTADLAIKEAQEEAAQILDRSRAESETLVTEARQTAENMTSEAERRLRDEVDRLTGIRDQLRDEANMLVSLLAAERERLTESLGTALSYVQKSLTPSAEIADLPDAEGAERDGASAGPGAAPSAGQPQPETTTSAASASSETAEHEVDDLEAAIAEDAAAAAPAAGWRRDDMNYDSEPSAATGYERPNLTALPALDDTARDTAAWPATASQQADWPA